jgi:hypothetical protein
MKKNKANKDQADEIYLSYSVRTNCAEQLNNRFEKEVIFKLNELGFTFKNRFEFIDFIKNHCTHQVFQDKLNVLLVDNKPFFKWYDTINTEIKLTEDGVKSTITMGLHPSESNNLKV